MRLYPNSKVYVLCPGNVQTGGVELCHQLVSVLISCGVSAYMLYYESGGVIRGCDHVHKFYRKYHVPYAFEAEDTIRNILIAPEGATEFVCNNAENLRRVIWWMSVDNYFMHVAKQFKMYLKEPLRIPLMKFFSFDAADSDITHFVQSEYARQFIKLNGVPEHRIYMVEDYLNQAFLSAQVDLSRKENFVAFNPQKGFEVTQSLMKLAPDIDWRPIQNMTPAQVQELLAKAKIYIDFGNHPGKDRIPREAAISGCVVITGRRGAAGNDVDINIPAEFKFDERTTDAQDVIKKIREVFADFKSAHAKQADYRARIRDDKNRFVHEVAAAFEIKNSPPPSVAFVQGVGEESFLLAEALFQSNDFAPSFIVDDLLASAQIDNELLLREQNRNYLRVGARRVEIITRDDAKFLYLERRISKFALLEPTDAELAALKNFYAPDLSDVLIFKR